MCVGSAFCANIHRFCCGKCGMMGRVGGGCGKKDGTCVVNLCGQVF